MTFPDNSGGQNAAADDAQSKSRVICFTSAKGGSGKTVLAASTAWLLMQAGCRVIVIDTDFSTRGLSLFVLESLTYSNPGIQPENCLADALLNDIPVERIRPLVIEQKRGTFRIILPNSNFRLGGAPEDKLLGLGGGPGDFELRFLNLLGTLCKRLRDEYDYILIDTRGGYDYSSKIPAILADGYVIVIEADPISVQQVNGLKTNIDEFGRTVRINPNHKGFIINKALYDPEKGEQLSIGLTSFYGGKVFGIIPADRSVIGAYQQRDIPFETDLGSDFSYYAASTLYKFVKSISRIESEADKKIGGLRERIGRAWQFSMVFVLAERWYPYVFVALLALTLAVLVIYFSFQTVPRLEKIVFITYISFILVACLMPIVKALSIRRQSGMKQRTWWVPATSFSAAFLLLFLWSAQGIHSVLSTYQLSAQEPKTMLAYGQALNQLGALYGKEGRNDEAQTAVSEAVAIQRVLVARHPGTYEPDLASTLSDLGTMYISSDQPVDRQKAYRAYNEALAIYRELKPADPTKYSDRIEAISKSLAKLGITNSGPWLH